MWQALRGVRSLFFKPLSDSSTDRYGDSITCLFGGNATCWGLNIVGQLGYGDKVERTKPTTPPIDFGTGRIALFMSVGNSHTCVVLDDYTLKCWGGNTAGELGNGSTSVSASTAPPTTVIELGTGRTAKSVAVGTKRTCAILDDNSVKCWGLNDKGYLGYGDTMPRNQPSSASVNLGVGLSAKTIAAEGNHTCVILNNGGVKCWGFNDFGQLGDGTTTDRDAPPATSIDLGSGRTAKSIAVGPAHVCAVLDDDTLKCWGNNGGGRLGYGDTTNRNKPDANAIDLGTGRTAQAVSVGSSHTCAILDNGSVKCWGGNIDGQLGYGDIMQRDKPASYALDLGVSRTALSISSAANNNCVVLDNHTIKCWGYNNFGQLGYGDKTKRNKPDKLPIELP